MGQLIPLFLIFEKQVWGEGEERRHDRDTSTFQPISTELAVSLKRWNA
jgi:hypothetical protein